MNFGMECLLRVFSSPVLHYSVSHERILVSGPRLQWFSGENTSLLSLSVKIGQNTDFFRNAKGFSLYFL